MSCQGTAGMKQLWSLRWHPSAHCLSRLHPVLRAAPRGGKSGCHPREAERGKGDAESKTLPASRCEQASGCSLSLGFLPSPTCLSADDDPGWCESVSADRVLAVNHS